MESFVGRSVLWIFLLSVTLWAGIPCHLQQIQVWDSVDSVRVTLHFSGSLPEKYRVVYSDDSILGKGLELAFLNAMTDTTIFHVATMPPWIVVHDSPEMGLQVLRVRIAVDRPIAYRGDWSGFDFSLTLPNAVARKGSLWTKPWVYLGLGAATLGGAVLWLTTGKSTSSKPTEIAPPDINLPE